MFGKQNDTHDRCRRRSNVTGTGRARLRSRLSYANVTASLALFVALGGTAAAAVTLPRDSVGASQIRKDAVRSPEIDKDAVRSSEIRDESINFGDVSTGAATKLRGDLFVAQDDNTAAVNVPECDSTDLRVCPDFLVLELGSGGAAQPNRNWLIHAKAEVQVGEVVGSGDIGDNQCGLVNTELTGTKAVLDQTHLSHLTGEPPIDKGISLTAVVEKRAGNPTIALRCTRQNHGPPGAIGPLDGVAPTFAKITALEVGSVTGP